MNVRKGRSASHEPCITMIVVRAKASFECRLDCDDGYPFSAVYRRMRALATMIPMGPRKVHSISENSKVSNSPDCRGALKDEVINVLGQQRTGDIAGHVLHKLRWYLHDECVGLALQAMFVTDSVVHGFEQGRRLGVVSNALVRKRAETWVRAVRSGLRRRRRQSQCWRGRLPIWARRRGRFVDA